MQTSSDGDEVWEHQRVYWCDDAGEVARIDTLDATGRITGVVVQDTQFTKDGARTTTRTYDYEGDGVMDYADMVAFDPDGARIEYRRDDSADGSWDYIRRTEHTDLVRRTLEDWNGDGAWDEVEEILYDAFGNHLGSQIDRNGDGDWDYISQNTWECL